ncbi:MAG: hypothetical protein Q8K70_12490 [Bacteroidota bacterium]|nr:hypothetical protein [Bacteroidota bacterium]
MKKLILSYSIFAITIFMVSCSKKDLVTKGSSSNNGSTQNTNPPVGETNYNLAELNHRLNGAVVTIAQVNSANVIQSVFHEEFDNTTVYHFTTNASFNAWIAGKSFETQLVRRNFVMDSLGNTGNENDTNGYLPFESNRPNNNGGSDIVSSSKRLSAGGATMHDGCMICGQPSGSQRTVAAWHRNLGSWNNRASQLNHFGIGWNTWCMRTNFRTPRSSFYFVGGGNVGLGGSSSDNNIESVY